MNLAEVLTPVTAALDERFMQLAFTLGQRSLGRAWPNPAVGAVVVKDGTIVGRGWTQPGGRPHAETEALKRAGKAAQGATMYVTLEPCSHRGQTPPCVDAILRAGIARVVTAIEDPNPQVAGQGHERLRAKGIVVETGLGEVQARRVHAGHIRRMRDGRPHVLLKLAISANGKAGAAGRRPVTITGEAVRDQVWLLRARYDAILVGIGTVLSDNPSLTCRLPGMLDHSPVRVVLDARLRVPIASSVVATARETPTWVVCAPQASALAEQVLRDKGVDVLRVEAGDGRLDLWCTLKALAARGITRLMIEGGPTVAASFVAADLVDEAVLFRSQKIIPDGIDALEGIPLAELTASPRLKSTGIEQVGEDTMERFERA
ncbi:MAG TPA: bifunctional diaminohydroxyphosphoribosylaminopyrimidine deaminase/5-amino-6-(5-phosphoribosylamino)uracil reductase RibD [Xanthobacteraceae bacterium]|nr:bifunctional diaminohydroxyphosphoribosylaminopyrimidine deaminase/5-amino-6-(5-phosphoribosylamino)uracil reductase RibD [Xanthobacteraceae bacterium]